MSKQTENLTPEQSAPKNESMQNSEISMKDLPDKVKEFVLFCKKTKNGSNYYYIKKEFRDAFKNRKPIERSNVIEYCVRKAWNDAISRERFQNSDFIKHSTEIKEDIIAKIKDVLKNSPDDFDNWHNNICQITCFGGKYGIWQKLLNMSFKYLYCFKDIADIKFEWKKCHCPIDSVIAKEMLKAMELLGISDKDNLVKSVADNEKKGVSWNSMKQEQYQSIQETVQSICRSKGIESKLYFDFLYWK